MRTTLFIIFWTLLLQAGFTPALSAQGTHVDKTYGYRIAPPQEWKAPARPSRDQWVIARFISKKATFYNDPQGWTWEFYPQMTVVAFVHDVIKNRGVKAKTEEDEDGVTATISLSNPYKNYKDYLKRTYYGGGYYFNAEEETTVKGIPVTRYEIKVEKLTRTGPRLIFAWVYHMEDLDIAVHVEILEKSKPKLRSALLRSFKSFKVIKRTGELPGEATETYVSRVEWKKLTPVERREKRMDLEVQAHAKAIDELPKGWRHCKVGRILVLENFNRNLAKDIARQCGAVMKWLDDTFPYVGPDEYVRAPILKVYKVDDSEPFSFGFIGLFDNIIIEYEHDPGWLMEWKFQSVNTRVLNLWFNDRDRDLHWAMPRWLDHGLDDLISNAKAKGKRLEFGEDIYDKVHLKQSLSKGTIASPRDLLLMGSKEFSAGRRWDESAALVRYLLIGPGSRKKKTKNIIADYLKNLAIVTKEMEEQEEEDGPEEKPTTEEEEDEYYRNKQNSWKEKEKAVLEETFGRTFAGWKETDWKSFEASYKRMIAD